MLPVNEIFDTLQGEATWTGTPSTFVRMQFCDVGCPWCDTKHTWPVDPSAEISAEEMLSKAADKPTYAKFPVDVLASLLIDRVPRHVVITGGEPCYYDLTMLTRQIHHSGKSVQIETSGTREIRCHPATWVTVSPKYAMPGGLIVLDSALNRADEIKMPVGKPKDVERVVALRNRLRGEVTFWLQPLSQSEKATELCIEAATMHGFKVSIQTHKFLGLR